MTDIATLSIKNSTYSSRSVECIEFQEFLKKWDLNYKAKINKIDLFNENLTSNISAQKKSYLVKAFYHIRGHFHDFLWHMGNHAPDEHAKEIIVSNIAEEFGKAYKSHEQLYYDFSESLGVDIKKEIIEETTYDPYIIQFNKGHLKWLNEHDWPGCLAAFSAYEHLDNIDYPALSSLANSLGASKEGMLFFRVHEKVKHFESLSDSLMDVFSQSPDKVKEGFHFIGYHQLNMWKNLSDRVFAD